MDDKLFKEKIEKAQNGDKSIRNQIVEENLKLVHYIAWKEKRLDHEIAFQSGCIGLIKAIDNYNIELDTKFSTYATHWIWGEIQLHIRDYREDYPYKLPRDLVKTYSKYRNAKEKLYKELKRESTLEEISKEIGETKEKINESILCIEHCGSLQDIIYKNDDSADKTIQDMIQYSENIPEKIIEKIIINEALNTLSHEEKEIIILRYFKGVTQKEIAQRYNISQPQVSRIEYRALHDMKLKIERGTIKSKTKTRRKETIKEREYIKSQITPEKLELLPPIKRQIIELIYIKNCRWKEVIKRTGKGSHSISRWKSEALEEMGIYKGVE